MRFYKNTRVLLNDNRMTTDIYIMQCNVRILRYLCADLLAFLSAPEKKKEELSLLSESNSRGTKLRFKKLNGWNLSQSRSFHTTSSLTSSSMKKYNDDKEKSEKKKGRNSPARVKTPRCTRTPFVRSFPKASFHSSAISFFLDTEKSFRISPREKGRRKQKDE